MTINTDTIVSLAIKWSRIVVHVSILVALLAILLKMFGIDLTLRTPNHVALAYIAGAYWLTK